MSTGEAACYLGITTRTPYGFVDRGQVIAHTHGRLLRFRRSDLDAYIESARVRPRQIFRPR